MHFSLLLEMKVRGFYHCFVESCRYMLCHIICGVHHGFIVLFVVPDPIVFSRA